MLTRKQHELLVFIQRRLNENGVSPSFDEMKEALGLKSKSGIHRLISGLEERGFIRRLPHRARALEILRGPDSGPTGATTANASNSNVVAPDFRLARTRAAGGEQRGSNLVNLPLYGRIAAGTPIEALRDESAFVDVPPALLSKGEHYCLEVEGESMVDAGIFDGDTVVIERCDAAENGSIIVALVDGEEVTLKRLRRKGHAIALEPANPAFETRIFPPDRVAIQGRLVALLRQY
ncbi:repressor LexA [Limimonas halophila]|uniref:LexA repressor n=1 Tax=Limimonas halophila TaxID=1082479 RepID=A0A1G7N9X6_9PROT|nr:transcriptional repressor LexA [Limimonas halophila]SDF70858.1 repressor LexA [Limimonas halophila]